VAPLTLPAHASLFTGRIPPAHGVRDNAGTLGDGVPTLAALLRDRGYRTAAFLGSVVLDAGTGVERGFDEYRGLRRSSVDAARRRFRRPADEVVDAALEWLEPNARAPFFAWLHFYDPHAPNTPPEPYRTRYADDPYAGALAFVDDQIARVLAALEAQGTLEDTAIIVAGDHGESLGDHGERHHGIFVYQSSLHVPLIVRWPGVRPRRVADLVRLIDVAPTVLDLEGLAPTPMDGTSLIPLLRGTGRLDLDGYAESMYPRHFGWSGLRTLRSGRFKVIEAPNPELYDLETDPLELRNVHAARPQAFRALLGRLERYEHGVADPARSRKGEVDERLAALGYASRTIHIDPRTSLVLPDPKDVIAQYNVMTERGMIR
jgi:arylsulfatase A-like enzyme